MASAERTDLLLGTLDLLVLEVLELAPLHGLGVRRPIGQVSRVRGLLLRLAGRGQPRLVHGRARTASASPGACAVFYDSARGRTSHVASVPNTSGGGHAVRVMGCADVLGLALTVPSRARR